MAWGHGGPAYITSDHQHCEVCWEAIGTRESCYAGAGTNPAGAAERYAGAHAAVLCVACYEAFIPEPGEPGSYPHDSSSAFL